MHPLTLSFTGSSLQQTPLGKTGPHVSERFLFEFEKEAWRAACQFLSQYKAWEYFDTCSRYQCAKHLIENNFTPEDI